MYRFWSVLAFITILSCSLFAENTDKPFFYKLIYQGQESYLLGTWHLGVKLSDLPPIVRERINESRAYLPEKVISLPRLELGLTDSESLFISDLTTIPSAAKKLSQNVKNYLIQKGIPRRVVELMTDEDCNYMFLAPELVFPNIISLDREVLAIAYDKKLKLIELDTEEIFAEAAKIQEADEGDDYSCSLTDMIESKEYEAYSAAFKRRVDLYLNGDEKEFLAFADPDVQYRNRQWLKSILIEVTKGNAFIGVGAGHLFGKDGLINLLKSSGVKVERFEATTN